MDGEVDPLFQVPPTFPLRVTDPPAQKVVFPLAEILEGVGAWITVTLI